MSVFMETAAHLLAGRNESCRQSAKDGATANLPVTRSRPRRSRRNGPHLATSACPVAINGGRDRAVPSRHIGGVGESAANAPGDRSASGPETDGLRDVCVIGLGHIGLPTALLFAEAGMTVAGVDTDPERVAMVNAARNPIGEAGLDTMLFASVAAGKLVAVKQPVRARAYLIAVPTPLTPAKRPDLTHLWEAAAAIADVLMPGAIVVLESTSPIGTTEKLSALLSRLRPDLGFPGDEATGNPVQIAYCPERVLPGRIIEELRQNDRVIGGVDGASAVAAAGLYHRIVRGQCHLTDARTAEMTKLAENAYRDVNIAFANELAAIAEANQINPRAIIAMANHHPRVDILNPGPGVGGHCIAVDPWFLADAANGSARLIPSARAVNDGRPGQIADQAIAATRSMHEPVIACFGLTYKADVADLRESPAVKVVEHLLERQAGNVLAVDPNVQSLPDAIADAELVEAGEALVRADLLILLVDHAVFKHLPVASVDGLKILDTRGLWTVPDKPRSATADHAETGERATMPRLVSVRDSARPAARFGQASGLPAAAPADKP